MFCIFPDSKSEWKKGATGQSFIRKEITTCRIGTLMELPFWRSDFIAWWLRVHISKVTFRLWNEFLLWAREQECTQLFFLYHFLFPIFMEEKEENKNKKKMPDNWIFNSSVSTVKYLCSGGREWEREGSHSH